jgi:UDP-N-acetylmuramoyl-tripeptide--D-alanyl-D-alanine ligase
VHGIARAKRELIENLKQPAVAVLNYDDVEVRRFADGFTGRVLTYGFEEGADLRAFHLRQNVGNGLGTMSQFIVVAVGGVSGEFLLPLLGRHNVQNALAAIATASLFDIPAEDLRTALATFDGLQQRGEILSLPSLITVINDSYNSNPLAMTRMLETLASWPGTGRRIVVAGEMLELGPTAPELHRQVGRRCVESRVDWLIAVQGDAACFLEGAILAGMPPQRTRFFSDAETAGEFCRELVRPLDLVLVKGSRAVHLERVVGSLQSPEKGRAESGAVSEGPN